MPNYPLRKNQSIHPYGVVALTATPGGELVASQKGYIGGHVVRVEVVIHQKNPSKRKIQGQMRQAFKKASLAMHELQPADASLTFLKITPEGKLEKYAFADKPPDIISSKFLPKKNVETKLAFEGPLSPKPPLKTYEIRDVEPGKLEKGWQKIARLFQIFSLHPQGHLRGAHIALSAEHLDTHGSHGEMPVKIVQKLFDSETLTIKLSPEAPSNFIEAHRQYSKQTMDLTPFYHRLLIRKFEQLAPGQCHIFSMGTLSHMMTGMVKKEANGTYTFYQANSGQGIDFHPKKLDPDGNMEFQKVYVVKNIPPKQLKKFISSYGRIKMVDTTISLFYPRFSDFMVKWLYQHLPKLGTPIREKDERFWGKPQIGASCTGQAEIALVKACLTDESCDQLQTHLKIHSVFKMYKQIVTGFDTHYSAKISVLEMVKHLQSGQLNPKMRASLEEIQKKIENRLHRQKALKLSRTSKNTIFKEYAKIDPLDQKPANLLKRACFLMASNQTQEAHQVLAQLYRLPRDRMPDQAEIEVTKTFIKLYKAERGIPLELLNLYYGAAQILLHRRIPVPPNTYYKLTVLHSYAEMQHLFPTSPWNMHL